MTYFHEIYPNLSAFKADLIIYVNPYDAQKNDIFNFDKNDNRYTTLTSLFLWFQKTFSGRSLRYDDVTFKTQFWSIFIEHYPNFYIQQLVFANKQLESLIDKTVRGSSQTNTPSGETTTTSFNAQSNIGKMNDSQQPFNLTNETLYQKSGSQTSSSFKNRVTTNNQQDLYLNAIQVTNSTMNFGLQQFCSNFIHLAKIIFVPNLIKNNSVGAQIEFDSDTIKKIAGKYRVIGIKDE